MPYVVQGDDPSSDEVAGYEAYSGPLDAQNWSEGQNTMQLSDNVTTYVTNGAGVSAPSENLGFYFSGAHTPGWEAPYYEISKPSVVSDRLITANITYPISPTWENDTLPSYVQGRLSGELVWVPVSENGVLVAIGGVLNSTELQFTSSSLSQEEQEKGEEVNPTFMESVPVYDISSKTWYLQNTTGDTPPALANFCSVLASAPDASSHNIYIYGGYNGIENQTFVPYDDVYILSLPSFKWVKAYNGTTTHARLGHKCVKVYPDQMLSVGGFRVDQSHCMEGGLITTFNLNNLTFQDAYDPAQWSGYKVPDLLSAAIGGE